ncbi:MAG: dTMP kinase, partial [Acidimicrobiales bacterium]
AIGVRAELLLLLAARAQHVEDVIRPTLESGRDVVCDRFSGSTVAYQGCGRGLPVEDVVAISSFASRGVEPDRVVLLQVPQSVALGRRVLRGGLDRFEEQGEDFFAAVDKGFRALAASDPEVWVVVDGVGSVEEVAARVWEAAQP